MRIKILDHLPLSGLQHTEMAPQSPIDEVSKDVDLVPRTNLIMYSTLPGSTIGGTLESLVLDPTQRF